MSESQPLLAGFELWIPPKSNKYDDGVPIYEIIGTDAQYVQFPLRPGRAITCFAGAMAYQSNDVKMSVKLGGFMNTLGRLGGGGSIFQVTYTNEGTENGFVAMSPDYPGIIVPLNMQETVEIYAQRDSFLCSTIAGESGETEVGAGFNPARSVGGFCCSGVDFIVQSIKQGEWAFLMAMGTVVCKVLGEGETILVDTNSVLCFETSIGVDIRLVGGCAACCCAGEGLFHTELEGPGKVWLQSMSIDKMRQLFPPNVQKSGGGSDGGGGGE